jgi:hypothetical protein
MEEPLSLSFATIHEILGHKVSAAGRGGVPTPTSEVASTSEVAPFREQLVNMLQLESLRAICNGT